MPTLQGTAFDLAGRRSQIRLGRGLSQHRLQLKPDAAIQIRRSLHLQSAGAHAGSSAVREVFGELLVPVIKDDALLPERQSRYRGFAIPTMCCRAAPILTRAISIGRSPMACVCAAAMNAPFGRRRWTELFSGNSTYYANTASCAGPTAPAILAISVCPTWTGRMARRSRHFARRRECRRRLRGVMPTTIPRSPRSPSGNPTLRPEKADTFTGGAVYQPELGHALAPERFDLGRLLQYPASERDRSNSLSTRSWTSASI